MRALHALGPSLDDQERHQNLLDVSTTGTRRFYLCGEMRRRRLAWARVLLPLKLEDRGLRMVVQPDVDNHRQWSLSRRT